MLSISDLNQRRQDALAADEDHVATPYPQRHQVDLKDRTIHGVTLDELRGTHYLRERLALNNDGIDDQEYTVHHENHHYETALIAAARSGYLAKVQLLLNAGADIDVTDQRKFSALYWAVYNRHTEVVRMLLSHGASTETNLEPRYKWEAKHTLLTAAFYSSYASNLPNDIWPVVSVLLEPKNRLDINECNSFGRTALHYAAVERDESLMLLLLDNGAFVNVRDTISGDTPLNELMKSCSCHNLPARPRNIPEKDADEEFVDCHVALAAILLEHGADPLILDNNGNTAAKWAHQNCGRLMPVLVDPDLVDDALDEIQEGGLGDNLHDIQENKEIVNILKKCVRPKQGAKQGWGGIFGFLARSGNRNQIPADGRSQR